jgi:uncharacterized protein with beta-barrel porin domain
VSYDIDFANNSILASTNDNQDLVAGHVHETYRLRALDGDVALALIAIESTEDYTLAMNTLGAEVAVDNQIASILTAIRFGDTLLSCAERTGEYRYFDEGRCGWLEIGGTHFGRDETSDNLGFETDGWQIAGGGQIDLDNDWTVGAAIAYEWRNLSVDDSNASSNGGQFQAGVSAKRRYGATELSSTFSIGYGDFAIDRKPLPGMSLEGDQRMWLVSGQVRAAHLIERGRWSLKPRIDLGVDYLSMDGFDEADDQGLGLIVDDAQETYVNVQPAIDVATEIESDGVLYRPRVSLGITQFIGAAAPSVSGRLASAPDDVDPFVATTDLDRTRLDLAAAIDVFTPRNLVVRAGVAGSFAQHSQGYGGSLKVEIPF